MKIAILIFFLFLSIIINAQSYLIGKKYTANIGTSCKLYNDGGCTIYNYCDLEFEKDSVVISNRTKILSTRKGTDTKKESQEKKRYKWSICKNVISIKNFKDFGKLTLTNINIIGHKIINNNEFRKIIFEPKIN
jgi:hypothetical protein